MASHLDDTARADISIAARPARRALHRVSRILRLAGVALIAIALLTNPAMTPELMAQNSGGAAATPPPSVVVSPVVARQVAEEQQFTGRIQAIQSVNVQARVEGYLQQVAFQEGSFVKTGDLLYQIEQGPYQAALAQAQAQLASANAQLASAQANLDNQEINVQRQQTLVQRDTVSQAVVDDAVAKRDTAKADVEAANAAIQNANAQIQTAQLNLGYTTISAPIDGRLGRTYVTMGNLISQASGTMATLVQLNPIRVAFSVPDTTYTTLVETLTEKGEAQDARKLFEPILMLPNGKTYEQKGAIAFTGNEIDASTGTITVYADFPNPTAVLLPGAFVVVKVMQADTTREPVIPASAVIQDKQGDYVFVLNSEDIVEQRRVTLGRRTASEVAVSDGLREGETIVVQGLQKIRPGVKVTPTPLQSDATATASTPLVSSDDPGAAETSANQPSGMGAPVTPPPSDGSGPGTDATTSGSGAPAPAPSSGPGDTSAAPASGTAAPSATGAPSTAPASTSSAGDATSGSAAGGSSGTAAPAATPPASAPAGSSSDAGSSAAPADPGAAAASAPVTTQPPADSAASAPAPAPAAAAPADAASDGSAAPTDAEAATAAPAADQGEDELADNGPAEPSDTPAAVRGSSAQSNAPLYNATPLQRPGDPGTTTQTAPSGN